MALITNVVLCNVPELSNTYENTINFKTKDSQLNYFSSKAIGTVKAKISTDTEKETLNIDMNLGQIKDINYLYLMQDDGKYVYYFVTEKHYKTSTISQLVLDCDVFQTYMFDYTFLSTFVDRCHVNRWVNNYPNIYNIQDEGLEYGEYEVEKVDKMYPMKPAYLISSTTPLGVLGENTPPIKDDELEQTTPDMGINPDNEDIPFLPEDNLIGGDWENDGSLTPSEPQKPDIPTPKPDDGQTSTFSVYTEDKQNLMGIDVDNDLVSNNYVLNPLTAGIWKVSASAPIEQFEAFKGVEYQYGNFFECEELQDVFNPFYSLSDKSFRVEEVGTGVPTSNYFADYSTTNIIKKPIKVDYGNYVILKSYTYLGYILIGFLNDVSDIKLNSYFSFGDVIGKAGTYTTNAGDKINGIYMKAFTNTAVNYDIITPFTTLLNSTNQKFGTNMYNPDNVIINNPTLTNEIFGDNVSIPVPIGCRYYDNTRIIDLTGPDSDIITPIISPKDCTVLFAGFSNRTSSVNIGITGEFAKYVNPRGVYVILDLGDYYMMITGMQLLNVYTGQIINQNQVIGTRRNGSKYPTNPNNSPIFIVVIDKHTGKQVPFLSDYPIIKNSSDIAPQWSYKDNQQAEQQTKEFEQLRRYFVEDIARDYNTIHQINLSEEDNFIGKEE